VREFFQQYVTGNDRVLDLGCGYGEFTRHVKCGSKFAMDLNPDAPHHLGEGVAFFEQDCSAPWPLPEASLDAVFTSNFFEHLPDKAALGRTLDQILRCLSKGGRLIALGPNIKFLPGSYWDFWDHYVPLTDLSLEEALTTRGSR
jgi:SAM-dependent methyltransferase